MEAYTKFQHFVSYFLPGAAFFLVVLMGVSVFTHTNLITNILNSTTLLPIGIVSASILGLLLDGFRHVCLEAYIERRWSSEDEQLAVDELMYKDSALYNSVLSDFYLYYEFAFNSLLVIITGLLFLPSFLYFFYAINFLESSILVIAIALTTLPVLFLYAKESYTDFTTVCLEILQKRYN